jgi:hypothetical protein
MSSTSDTERIDLLALGADKLHELSQAIGRFVEG